MKKEEKFTECCNQVFAKGRHDRCGGSNAIYGLGVIGALFYFLQGAAGFTAIVVGIGKAIFWPAILMFELLSYLQL